MQSQPSTQLQTPNFNAQHSPMGAFMSFTCGNFDRGGGIGVEVGAPADQDIFVGVKQGSQRSTAPLICLPFFRTNRSGAGAADFQVAQDAANTVPLGVESYAAHQIERKYQWATDTWVTPDFQFTLYTPFDAIPEPGVGEPSAVKAAVLPAVTATLQVDNRHGNCPKTAVFAIRYPTQGVRALSAGKDYVGFGWRRSMGMMAKMQMSNGVEYNAAPTPFQRWTPIQGLMAENDPIHALGTCGGFFVEVPPGAYCTLTIALGVYLDGIVTTGLEGRYLYTKYYSSLEDVLATALDRSEEIESHARQLDASLAASKLSAAQQFLIAHSTRSYYGSTQLLEIGGEPCWIVNEGEYCMMNTLDLSVDQVFWELDRNPWVVRNLLNLFSRRYSYVDHLHGPHATVIPGGLTFTHDMGVNNHFSPPGHSSYEQAKLEGCFSYMSAEQLCNWVLMASCYAAATRDSVWLQHNRPLIRACLESLIARGGTDGFIAADSARCQGGQEITTYDSLDHSLAQTRNNLYMAVKCWASYLGLEQLGAALGDADLAQKARGWTERVARSVVSHVGDDGIIPAIFEPDSPGHLSRILPAIEGLVYPLYWRRVGWNELLDSLAQRPGSSEMTEALKRHTLLLLQDPQSGNLFPDGGIRLSSTSNNSWMSKIAIFQHVARQLLGADFGPILKNLFARADAAHMAWQVHGSAYWACSDQMVNGVACGSRYYPRIITTALWLSENQAGDRKSGMIPGVGKSSLSIIN